MVRLTFLPSDMPRLSSPRLGHGRQHACLFLLNLYIISSVLSLVLPFSPNFSNSSSPKELASAFADYLKSHVTVSQPKALHSRDRENLSKLRRDMCPEEFHSSFCSPFPPLNFLRLTQTSSRPLPLAQTESSISC